MSRSSDDGNLDSSEVSPSSAESKIVPKTTSKCQEDCVLVKDGKTKPKQDEVNKDSTNKGSSSKDLTSPITNRVTRLSILKQEVYKQREKFLSMDLESKRKLYKNKHTALEEIKTWPEYYKEIHKGSQKTGKHATISNADEHFEVREDLNQKLSIFQGDITTLEIDAIVNAANESLLGGGGVDGAIHRAAGSNLVAECEILDGCVAGDAKITCGYKLPAKYVIHTVGPRGENPKVLRKCYIRCLELLKKHNLKTIAFPCISTGIFGYPNTRAARVVLETLREWLETDEYAVNVERIVLCLFLKVDVDIYKKLIQVFFPVGSSTLTDVNENSSTESTKEENSPGQSDKTSDNEEESAPHKGTESTKEENSPGQSDKTSDNEEESAPHKDES